MTGVKTECLRQYCSTGQNEKTDFFFFFLIKTSLTFLVVTQKKKAKLKKSIKFPL